MTRTGFPHSDISGSMHICCSPKLIAAYRVLHRLPMPRHSPCALFRLNYSPLAFANFVPYMSFANRFFSLIVIQLPAVRKNHFILIETFVSFSFSTILLSSSDFTQTRFVFSFYIQFSKYICKVSLAGGLKWIRTIDLALIRRAL